MIVLKKKQFNLVKLASIDHVFRAISYILIKFEFTLNPRASFAPIRRTNETIYWKFLKNKRL